jgi:hypothetical protein|tara:strand:- start:6654 stop:6956 length:303 start_codon:yes stop_codon:yes gene_type:complete
MLKLILIMNLVDALATLLWIRLGIAEEDNPIMEFVLEINESAFILIKTALVVLSIFLLWRMKDFASARILTIPVFLIYSYVTILHLSAALNVLLLGGVIL